MEQLLLQYIVFYFKSEILLIHDIIMRVEKFKIILVCPIFLYGVEFIYG